MVKRISLTVIFLAVLAAGCRPRANISGPMNTAAPAVTSVAHRTLPPGRVVGEQRCASSGCHGRARDGTTRDWRSAYALWLEEDPHQRAFAVLYTERAVEMYRHFHPESKLSTEPPPDIPFEAFLGERCLGCHATGLAGRGVVALAEGGDRPAFYLAGVSCESCHGPASAWLDTHYLAGFSRSMAGFHDTKRLDTRAEGCVGCHVGPMIAENGKAYDLNHDLIAAGHPRLAFEFTSYLANLPKHWDERAEIVFHQPLGRPMTFHIDAWAAGQEQVARQRVRQVEYRVTAAKRDPNSTPWPDFSNFDCYDCHHTIGPPGNERTTSAQRGGRNNAPRPAVPLETLGIMSGPPTPGDNSQLMNAIARVQAVLSDSWLVPVAKIDQPAAEELAILTNRSQPPLVALSGDSRRKQHARWLLAQLEQWKRPLREPPESHRFDPTWDQAVHLYFGAAALAQDVEGQQSGLFQRAADALGGELEHCGFRDLDRPPTQYDSPTGFDPGMLDSALRDLEKALHGAAEFDSPSADTNKP